MIDQLDAYEAGDVSLGQLVSDLKGLLTATDLHDDALVSEFWDHWAPIDSELELRTESWSPAGSARDENLARTIGEYRAWASQVLAATDDERT